MAGVAGGAALDGYAAVRVLGEGPGCKTELVACEDTASLAVRKTLAKELANPSAWEALAGVAHPSVPRVLSLGWRGDAYEVVYAFVPGESLAELVGRVGRLEEERAALLLCDVASAAEALHRAGIVHRDISPGNVIVDKGGRAHLTDLGIARLANEQSTHDTTRLGTWGFAAPEQYGFAQTDARSDVYSMGRLLAFACTGAMPEVVTEPLEVGAGGLGALDAELAAIIVKACAFEPSMRYQSAQEFGTALERFVAARSQVARYESLPEPAPKPAPKPAPEQGEPGRLGWRILGWFMVVTFVFSALIVGIAGIDCLFNPDVSKEPVGSFVAGISMAALYGDCAYETIMALLRRGIYVPREGRVKKLLLRYLRALGIFVAAVFALAAIVAALGM